MSESVGDLDSMLAAAEEKARLDQVRGAERGVALARGKIADVLQERGEWEEALRIRREELLPVFERLGDARSRALTWGGIADVLQQQGEWEEALRTRREDMLPVFERLGDARSRALTLGKIADVLQVQGEVDEALRIRRQDQLPVFERLGDVRSRALTQRRIADVLQEQGEWGEALNILRNEVLPAFERLEDIRSRVLIQGKIADVLQGQEEVDDVTLLRGWRAGDKPAAEILLRRYIPALRIYFSNKVAGVEDADDLIQDTFLACVRSVSQFNGEESFRTFLYQIARNKLYEYYRIKRRRPESAVIDELAIADLRPERAHPYSRNRYEMLLEGLRQLPLADQELLEFRYWEKMKFTDIANILGISEHVAKGRLIRAKERLRQILNEFASR